MRCPFFRDEEGNDFMDDFFRSFFMTNYPFTLGLSHQPLSKGIAVPCVSPEKVSDVTT